MNEVFESVIYLFRDVKADGRFKQATLQKLIVLELSLCSLLVLTVGEFGELTS